MNSLDHALSTYFDEFSRASSFEDLRRLPRYQEVESEIERILGAVSVGCFAPETTSHGDSVRAAAWNIERGIEFEGIVDAFRNHPVLRGSEVLLLTELDYGMARSRNLKIPLELARSLEMNYAFAPCYINLEKGSGLESSIAGENDFGLHGNAVLSRYPLRESHSIDLPNGKDKMAGKEKRLGSQKAVCAVVEHPLGAFRAVSVHLDAHSTQKHRMQQMRLILNDLDEFHPDLPALIGGDWNTSTYNSRNALFSILGYVRRVLMGVRHVIKSHYPYPDRWFERHLFRELTRRGYRYQDLNQPGACTLHYDINDLAANGRMSDWIPNWCFWFINWALEKNGGKCSFKLDWFAGKRIRAVRPDSPRVITDVHTSSGPLSDHDPIFLDFEFS